MIMEEKKFKCVNCGQIFITKDDDPLCPYCCSDNITPYKNRRVGLIITCAIMGGIALGFGGVYLYKSIKPTPTQIPVPSPAQTLIQGQTSIPDPDPIPGDTVMLIELSPIPRFISDPEVILVGESYNVTVKAEVDTKDKLTYELCEYNTDNVKYSNSSGEFKGVEAAVDGTETYTIYAVNTSTNDRASINIPGFKKIVVAKPIEKLTKEELQAIFNSGNETSDLKSKFANKYTLTFNGLPADEPAPDRYSEIFNRLIAGWLSVEVVNVTYNSMNYITSIEFNVNL